MTLKVKLEWAPSTQLEVKQSKELEVIEDQGQIINYYKLFLTKEDFLKYQPITKEKEITMSDVDLLIEVETAILKNLWIKKRYPNYYSKQWAYLNGLTMTAWANLEHLYKIKRGEAAIKNLVHIFQYK